MRGDTSVLSVLVPSYPERGNLAMLLRETLLRSTISLLCAPVRSS